MSSLAEKILKEFRLLPGSEQRELAAVIATEVGLADTAERLRVLEEVTTKYRAEAESATNLDDAWVEGVLRDKRAE